MRRLLALTAVAACGRSTDEPPRAPEVIERTPVATAPAERTATIVVDGLAAPESAVHDTEADVYLVSNVNGDPADIDGNGFISRVSPDGQILDLTWIDGQRAGTTLNAPRGLALDRDTLYAVDVDALRLFDRHTGAPKGAWPIPDPHFPNDITIDDQGRVIITETGVHVRPDGMPLPEGVQAIWRYDTPGAAPTALAQGDRLLGPNGIVWTPHGLVVAAFLDSILYRLDADGDAQRIAELPLGRLDGLVAIPDGSFLTTSWTGKAIYRVAPDGAVTTIVNGADIVTPASIEYDAARGRILIPLLKANQLRIESWTPTTAAGPPGMTDPSAPTR